MDAAALRVFEAVARLGGMNKAASELNMVQSNVTARIRHLEAELGAPLFQRHARGVTPTAAGRRLLPFAERIDRLLADARRGVADDGRPGGDLPIGALETTTALRLSPLLAGYAAEFPEVDLILRTGTTAELIDGVLEQSLEGAFVCGPVDHPDLTAETVFCEHLVAATAKGVTSLDALARHPGVKVAVLRAGCSYRQRLEDALARRGVVGLRLLEFGTIDSVLASVAANLGVTLLPRGILAPHAQAGRLALHELTPAEAAVETQFIRRKDVYASSAMRAFVSTAHRADLAEAVAA